jgi:beta-glucosidase
MQIEQRIDTLISQMTLKEKIALLSGKDIWNTVPIERLGIPAIVMTDGPHGVRASNEEVGRKVGPTTAFPTGISMAASWNTDLVERVGQALGEETRAMDCDILLGPCVNIMRYPLGGRNFESYAEDPYLAGRVAIAYINGVQSRGVGTSLKHYALNNYEIERYRASSNADERTMREIYLPQFEMAVKEAHPWTVMCSYNRINGVYASEHGYLLNKILKEEWGYEGAVISDWSAVHDIYEPVKNGLDLEMPGPAKYFKLLPEALHVWQLEENAIDKAVRRILRLIILSGRMDDSVSVGSVNTPEHHAVARELAEEAITLLKNEGEVLPLRKGGQLGTVAVIGPNAAEAVIEGGGSSRVTPFHRISPLAALRTHAGDSFEIVYERGCDNYDEPPEIPPSWWSGPTGEFGLRGTFYSTPDFSGEPLSQAGGFIPDFWWHTAWSGLAVVPASMRWEGKLTVPDDGEYLFRLSHNSTVSVYLNGDKVLEGKISAEGPEWLKTNTAKKLTGGKTYDLRIELALKPGQEIVSYGLGIGPYFPEGQDPRLDRAVEMAKHADVALIFAGMPEAYESEGRDVESMKLPGKQDDLIFAVAHANPRTVVVLNTGIPVTMPWLNEVAAVVEAYYPGQENGDAITRVLLGEVNPSGKLTVTFPKRLQDSPAHINSAYPGTRNVNYGEGIFVGYRYFDYVDMDPLFPFGHGLSYTNFEYSDLKVSGRIRNGEKVNVSLVVKNTGPVAGKEVVQIYVSDPQFSLVRPPKELKAFTKVALKSGETKTVSFTLDERAFAYYDVVKQGWVAEPGLFEILAASSSRDVRLRTTIELA